MPGKFTTSLLSRLLRGKLMSVKDTGAKMIGGEPMSRMDMLTGTPLARIDRQIAQHNLRHDVANPGLLDRWRTNRLQKARAAAAEAVGDARLDTAFQAGSGASGIRNWFSNRTGEMSRPAFTNKHLVLAGLGGAGLGLLTKNSSVKEAAVGNEETMEVSVFDPRAVRYGLHTKIAMNNKTSLHQPLPKHAPGAGSTPSTSMGSVAPPKTPTPKPASAGPVVVPGASTAPKSSGSTYGGERGKMPPAFGMRLKRTTSEG